MVEKSIFKKYHPLHFLTDCGYDCPRSNSKRNAVYRHGNKAAVKTSQMVTGQWTTFHCMCLLFTDKSYLKINLKVVQFFIH